MVAAIPVTYDLGMLKILARGPFEVSALSDRSKLINPEIMNIFAVFVLAQSLIAASQGSQQIQLH